MVANAAFQHSVLSECNSGITVCCDVIPRGMENVGGCVRSSYLDGRRNIAIALIGDRPCSDRAERGLDSGVTAAASKYPSPQLLLQLRRPVRHQLQRDLALLLGVVHQQALAIGGDVERYPEAGRS